MGKRDLQIQVCRTLEILNLMLRYEFDFPTWQYVIRERMVTS